MLCQIYAEKVVHETDSSLWIWPFKEDRHTVKRWTVLPIRPSLDISLDYSSNRVVVFKLLNAEIIDRFFKIKIRQWALGRLYLVHGVI